ncbi:NBS-LRR type resistance protein [Cucumis melo var. makuwa]|uniref:NBS-LRR type resistance protein n=1 Tax=Cucumis melo var. makuwa TaxID=1194695 RepID=A0A5D3DFQ2_CUCMM|nr:NBS-LRR type resistance protein [Cucumis melo var. makuwa]TYK22527.1 NBS-LRR type resistance protein [Cucumis melo var. makuwa]
MKITSNKIHQRKHKENQTRPYGLHASFLPPVGLSLAVPIPEKSKRKKERTHQSRDPKDARISLVTPKDTPISLVIPKDARISLVIPKDALISLVIPKGARISLVFPNDTHISKENQRWRRRGVSSRSMVGDEGLTACSDARDEERIRRGWRACEVVRTVVKKDEVVRSFVGGRRGTEDVDGEEGKKRKR